MTVWTFLLLTILLLKSNVAYCNYLVGLGSYDITGPAADVNMMGYANTEQIASGVHFRLRSRAFIVAEPKGNRVVFVNLDACMGSQLVTIKVLERLKARYGDIYTENNVAISGIHTHAGPGGYLQYVVYIVTSLGFVRQSFDALVDGIEKSIVQAHENIRPGSIFVNKGHLLFNVRLLSNIAHHVGAKRELKKRRNEESDCTDEMEALSYDEGIEGGDFVNNVNEVVKMKNVETHGWLRSIFQYMDSIYDLLKRL